MDRRELINRCTYELGAANGAEQLSHHEHYAEHMQRLLDLLIEELVGSAPGAPGAPSKTFNPERVLEEIAIAVKHRTISDSHRWKIIYYHTRLTCVPDYATVPDQIVLGAFTEGMVDAGFTVAQWNQLKQNITQLFKELYA